MKKIVVFTSPCPLDNEPIIYEISADEKNVVSIFKRACEEAENDGFRGYNYELPEKYLTAFGLKMRRIKAAQLDIEQIGYDCMEVTPCTCNQCSAYEEGHCFRYGGIVDGFAIGNDCLHGTNGYKLFYDDSIVSGVIFETKLEPAEAVNYILNSDEEPLEELKEDILKFLDDEGIDTPEKDLWNFEEDM